MTATPANALALEKSKSPKFAGLYCRASWHVRHNSNAAVLHDLTISLSDNGKKKVHLSLRQVADYYTWGMSKTVAAFQDCIDAGLLVLVRAGQGGRPSPGKKLAANEYHVRTHKELSEAHPESCINSETALLAEQLKRRRTHKNRTVVLRQQSETAPPAERKPLRTRSTVSGVGFPVESPVVVSEKKQNQLPRFSTPTPTPKPTGTGKPEGEYIGMVGPMMRWINGELDERHLILTESSRRWAVDQIAHGMTGAQALRTLSEKAKSTPDVFVAVAAPAAPALPAA